MASGKRKMIAPSRNKAAKMVSQPINLTADMVSWAGATSVDLFTTEELGQFDVLVTDPDFVVVRCGITSRRYGDYVGRIKICRDGKLRITCECFDGCPADNLTVFGFEEHTKPPVGEARWKGGPVWAFTKDGNRIPLFKTKLLKYYPGSPYDSWIKIRPQQMAVHRDEFVTCTKCNKRRRFLLGSQEKCQEYFKIYHDSSLNENWTCADFPFRQYSCEDDDERLVKMAVRGCRKEPACKGCPSCVCFGCSRCRFEDCDCRSCVDFIKNAGTQKTNEEK